jgi:DNA ligase-associated metallophosphoesterase
MCLSDICTMAKFTKVSFSWANLDLELHPLKALVIPEKQTVVISDLHVGKAEHFRQNGIPIPLQTENANFWNVVELFEDTKPTSVLFLGDLMHSAENRDWMRFIDVLDQFPHVHRILARGNHDLYGNAFYEKEGFEVVDQWTIGECSFAHHPQEEETSFHVAGHLHPAVRLTGKATQSIKLPCFYFKKKQAILPAFGAFTGNAMVRPSKKDRVFVVAENKVFDVSAKTVSPQ